VRILGDDATFRAVVRQMLAVPGGEATEAADGEEGLRVFRGRGADVVLCDLFMPASSPGVAAFFPKPIEFDGLLGALRVLA
jgi:CheY-like chemotaxis protein